MKTKQKCCGDKPRCKKCPVVWKRLEKAGFARREGKHRYVVVDVVPKQALAAARCR